MLTCSLIRKWKSWTDGGLVLNDSHRCSHKFVEGSVTQLNGKTAGVAFFFFFKDCFRRGPLWLASKGILASIAKCVSESDKAVSSDANSITSTGWDSAAIGRWGSESDVPSFTPGDSEEYVRLPAGWVGDTQWGSESFGGNMKRWDFHTQVKKC